MKISGNTILITGGTSGIGLELARQLIARGNTVLITGRDEARLEATRTQLPGVHTFRSDVADPRAIEALFRAVLSRFPALNVLINNAGIMRMVNLSDGQRGLEELTREVQTNLVGSMQMVQQFLPQLRTQPEAAIMNVSSGLAFIPFPISPIYCATKAGVHSYTQSLRAQLKSTSVKVFELAPPATKTELDKDFPAGLIDARASMDVVKMVQAALRGMEKDRFEILPGLSPVLRLIGRVLPRVTLMTKPVEALMAQAVSRPALAADLGR